MISPNFFFGQTLRKRGTTEADGRYSWTIDFASRRRKAREEIEPILARASALKEEVVDRKEEQKRLKKAKASDLDLTALASAIAEKEKTARELEAQAAAIDATVFDFKAVNPNTVAKFDARSPAEIIQSIERNGVIVSQALSRLSALIARK